MRNFIYLILLVTTEYSSADPEHIDQLAVNLNILDVEKDSPTQDEDNLLSINGDDNKYEDGFENGRFGNGKRARLRYGAGYRGRFGNGKRAHLRYGTGYRGRLGNGKRAHLRYGAGYSGRFGNGKRAHHRHGAYNPGPSQDYQWTYGNGQYPPSYSYGPYQFRNTFSGTGVGTGVGAGVGAGFRAGAGAGVGAGVGAGIGPYTGADSQRGAKLKKITIGGKLERVFDSESGLFCQEISFGGDTGDYDDAKRRLFTYTGYTDMDGFPIYYNKIDGQYMVRPLDDNQNYGAAEDSSEQVKSGSLNEYAIFETNIKLDIDSRSHLLQMIPSGHRIGRHETSSPTNTARCEQSGTPPRPATSIWVKWKIPKEKLDGAISWELGCTVKPLKSYLHTYFMTVGWYTGGYGGFQETPDLKKAASGKLALFSFFDKPKQLVRIEQINRNDGIKDDDFKNEGTGQKVFTDFNWKLGEEISMKVIGKQIGNTWEVSGYIKGGAGDIPEKGDYAEFSTNWIFMATFSRTGGNPLHEHGFDAFIEDWDRGNDTEGFRHRRSAEFRNPYLLVNTTRTRVDLEKPEFSRREIGFDAFALQYVNTSIIGPPGSGNVYMSTGL